MILASSFAETVMSGSLLLAIPVALLAGIVSFLSPCVLPLAPGYLSLITGLAADELTGRNRGRVLAGTIGFTAGFGLLFMSYGLAFGEAGARLAPYQQTITRVMGVIVILLGFAYIGRVPLLDREYGPKLRGRGGVALSPFLGLVFGLGWIPCVGPTLAAVQTLAFTEANATRGALLSLVYALGIGLPFMLIGLFFERALTPLRWIRQHRRRIQQFGGLMLLALGVLLVTGLWDQFAIEMRTWISNSSVLI